LTRDSARPLLLGAEGAPPTLDARKAMTASAVYAVVSAVAQTCSTLPLQAWRSEGEQRVRVTSGTLAGLLARPAPGVPMQVLLSEMFLSMITAGDAFVAVYRDGDGRPHSLGVLDPTRVGVESKGGLLLYTVTGADGRRQTVDAQHVVQIRAPMSWPGSLRGISPLATCAHAVGLAQALDEHARSILENGARISGLVKVPPGPAVDELLENLRAGLEARHRGPQGAGRLAIVSGDVSVEALSISPADLQLAEMQRDAVATISRVLGVPPSIVNGPSNDSLTYSTTEGEGLAFKRALRPWLGAVEAAVSGSALCHDGEHVAFDLTPLDLLDARTRVDVRKAELDPVSGWRARAEIRIEDGLPAEEATLHA
jgi:HK97 family phage portal protein